MPAVASPSASAAQRNNAHNSGGRTPGAALKDRIFNDVFNLYTGEGDRVPALETLHRLEDVSTLSHFQPPLLHPRKRVTVLIIGNHSAGKSSFINWYCEQPVLATGVAVESQGFTLITYGKDTTSIKGEGTIRENQHLRAVADRLGKDRDTFIEYLQV